MAYWAKIENNIVTQITIGSDSDTDGGHQWLIDNIGGNWVETTMQTIGGVHYDDKGQPDGGRAIRMNTASIGGLYDSEKDVFMQKSPYPSWVLDPTTYFWKPPVDYPTDGKIYAWDENSKSWLAIPLPDSQQSQSVV